MWIKFVLMVRRWCDRRLGVDPRMGRLPILSSHMIDAAEVLVKEMHGGPTAEKCGEYKRDRVYKKLLRQFPATARSSASVAIEVAYNGD